MRKTTAALLLAGALASVPTAASAGKGGGNKPPSGGSGSTLQVVNVDPADATVSHGDTVRFAVSTTATTKPFVEVFCHQGGSMVLSWSAGYFDGYPWSQDLHLASMSWTGGAASCNARLYSTNRDGTRTTTLATLAFAATD